MRDLSLEAWGGVEVSTETKEDWRHYTRCDICLKHYQVKEEPKWGEFKCNDCAGTSEAYRDMVPYVPSVFPVIIGGKAPNQAVTRYRERYRWGRLPK